MTFRKPPPDPIALRGRARDLGLHGMVRDWESWGHHPWLPDLLTLEEQERTVRSLERRQRRAQVGRFKMLADFDWTWPQSIDREQVEELMTLAFIEQGTNVVICGPNGVGKTMVAQNLAHRALLSGATVKWTTAAEMLRELSEAESGRELTRRLQGYVNVKVLVIDEVGYLSYGTRYADLMFEVVTRRYTGERSVVVTTNKAFGEWDQIFGNAASVVTLVDRLVHRSEVVVIEGESWRLKEAKESGEKRKKRAKKPGR